MLAILHRPERWLPDAKTAPWLCLRQSAACMFVVVRRLAQDTAQKTDRTEPGC
jgi:hypothetical protein